MRKTLISGLLASSAVIISGTAFAGNAPAAAVAAPVGTVTTSADTVNTLTQMNNTQQSPAVVDNIGSQIANAGGNYNAATGFVQAYVDTGAGGVYLLTIEGGNVSFTPAES